MTERRLPSPRARRAVVGAIAYGPASLWILGFTLATRARLGWGRALALAAFTGLGVLGLTALVLAYLPATLERLGLTRFAAWLRTWWDPDAR